MRANVELFIVGDSAPIPERSKVEFPVRMWFERVPAIGEKIEFADVATGDYQDMLLEVQTVIWTVDERKPDQPEADPQFGDARPQLGCRVVST